MRGGSRIFLRAVWQHTAKIDDCSRQNPAYRTISLLDKKTAVSAVFIFSEFFLLQKRKWEPSALRLRARDLPAVQYLRMANLPCNAEHCIVIN